MTSFSANSVVIIVNSHIKSSTRSNYYSSLI